MTTSNINGIDTDALKALMGEIEQDHAKGIARFGVKTEWRGATRTTTRVKCWSLGGQEFDRDFSIEIDEPPELLGSNQYANPQEYLFGAVNACVMASFVAASSVMGIRLDSVEMETSGDLDLRGFLALDKNVKAGYDEVDMTIRVTGDGTQAQFDKVLAHVKATSPNYFNLERPVRVNPRVVVG